MRAFLRIDDIWPKGITVNQAAEELEMNPRSVSTLRRGTEKGTWVTLIKVQRWLASNGREYTLEDLIEVEEDELL